MTPGEMAQELREFSAKLALGAKKALREESPVLLEDFKKRAPVDTGEYKESWQQTGVQGKNKGSGTVATVTFKNNDPIGYLLEYGVEPGAFPWYYPNPFKTPSGKLKQEKGAIWAGGLSPGHDLTVGGAIDPVLFANPTRQQKIAEKVADCIMQEL